MCASSSVAVGGRGGVRVWVRAGAFKANVCLRLSFIVAPADDYFEPRWFASGRADSIAFRSGETDGWTDGRTDEEAVVRISGRAALCLHCKCPRPPDVTHQAGGRAGVRLFLAHGSASTREICARGLNGLAWQACAKMPTANTSRSLGAPLGPAASRSVSRRRRRRGRAYAAATAAAAAVTPTRREARTSEPRLCFRMHHDGAARHPNHFGVAPERSMWRVPARSAPRPRAPESMANRPFISTARLTPQSRPKEARAPKTNRASG